MKRYIIRTGEGEAFNAASKARRDAEEIAVRRGYEVFTFQGARTAEGSAAGAVRLAAAGYRNWKNLIKQAEPGSIILVQYPHYPMKSAYLIGHMLKQAKKKDLRFIALVHDLDSIRGLHGSAAKYSDRNVLPLFDVVICHNQRMKDYLVGQGVSSDRLVILGIFDYLTVSEPLVHEMKDGVAIAGNLSREKSGYIHELMLRDNVKLNLYGKGMEGKASGECVYHGAFPPEILPGRLEGAFGLVWDGPSLTECLGEHGEYIRYNDPHKFSLYLAAGLPVIIWKEAALAEFAAEKEIGITVESLSNLDEVMKTVSGEMYDEMKEKAEKIGAAVREGTFLESALQRAEIIVKGRKV